MHLHCQYDGTLKSGHVCQSIFEEVNREGKTVQKCVTKSVNKRGNGNKKAQ